MLKARLNEVDFPLPLFAGELLIRYRVEIRVQAFSNGSSFSKNCQRGSKVYRIVTSEIHAVISGLGP